MGDHHDTPDGAQVMLHNTRYQLILVCEKSSRNSSESEASLLRCCVVGLVCAHERVVRGREAKHENQTRLPRAILDLLTKHPGAISFMRIKHVTRANDLP